MSIKNIFKYILLLFLLLGIIIISTEIIISNIKEDNYSKEAQNLHKQLKTLIDEKQSTTSIIGVSLAQNESIKDAIITNKPDLIDLNKISLNYRADTTFKNVWLHIVTKEGISFSRSWVKKRGDSILKVRMDIPVMLKNPAIKSHISAGIFDLTFKAMVPIYKDSEFIGIFEVITHFNSISKKLFKNNNIESVFLVDKSYKKQIRKPFTKMFVNDYYVANLDAPKEFRDFLTKKNNLEILLDKKIKYFIDEKNDRFITVYNLPDIKGNDMAYMFMSKQLSLIKHQNIATLRMGQLTLVLIGIFIFVFIVLYRKVKINESKLLKQNSQLEKQKHKTRKIFDAGPAITILTDGVHIREANKEFFNFFSNYSTLEEFTKEHDCICDFFEYVEDENYIGGREIEGEVWINFLIEKNSNTYKVKMIKDNKEYHFVVIANLSNTIEDEDNLIVVSLIDITQEVKLQNDLRKKDKILLQQSKMISMGEMISNIAHQWRQPLSVISTVSTGLKMKIEFDMFDIKDAIKNLDTLNENAQYLSKTIDDFRNLFNKDMKKETFDINTLIKKDKNLINTSLKNHYIQFISETDEEKIEITSYENILTQALLNVVNNAKDAFLNKDFEDKVILTNTSIQNNKVIIAIKDNAGGIKENIIERIFEPYFTTKHKSQGTGIGLYMTEQIVSKHLSGNISAKNVEFEYKGKRYKGAEFRITLPLN